MLGFKIDISGSGMEKLSQKTYSAILSDVLDHITDEAVHEMMKPGEGVAGGKNPSGGAPVDTGNLRGSIVSYKGNPHVKYIKTPNVEYVQYVINGTSKMAPNNFPLRAIEALEQNQTTTKALDLALQKRGLK